MAIDDKSARDQALPAWLVAPACAYDPPTDRDGFLRKNILSLAAVLLSLRSGGQRPVEMGFAETWLARANPALRLVATLVLVTCVSLARNFAFVWAMAACWLALLAARPASRIHPVLMPALAAAGVALVVNLPALLLGQSAAPLRMAGKSLVTVGLVANLASSLGSDGMLDALRNLHMPGRLVLVVDLAIRDVVQLGEVAVQLSEALALRSVGRDRTKTSSATGVMGVVFVRAHTMAAARAEAMELRGYDGTVPSGTKILPRVSFDGASMAHAVMVAGAVVLFLYLEAMLP